MEPICWIINGSRPFFLVIKPNSLINTDASDQASQPTVDRSRVYDLDSASAARVKASSLQNV